MIYRDLLKSCTKSINPRNSARLAARLGKRNMNCKGTQREEIKAQEAGGSGFPPALEDRQCSVNESQAAAMAKRS